MGYESYEFQGKYMTKYRIDEADSTVQDVLVISNQLIAMLIDAQNGSQHLIKIWNHETKECVASWKDWRIAGYCAGLVGSFSKTDYRKMIPTLSFHDITTGQTAMAIRVKPPLLRLDPLPCSPSVFCFRCVSLHFCV